MDIIDNDLKKAFEGRLSDSQRSYLKNRHVSDHRIKRIEYYLGKYKDSLSDYSDLVGDNLVPGKMFFFNMKHFGYLLEQDSEKVLSKNGLWIRGKITYPLIKKMGPYFLNSTQIFENRNELKAFAKAKTEFENNGRFGCTPADLIFEKDPGIDLPDKPVIWTLNHHFKDDALASVIATQRPITMLFGSVPHFFNTFDGVLSYAIGLILINRKVKASRAAAQVKLNKAINLGSDLFIAPEGVWCKYPHQLLLPLWPGIYRCAKENGIKVVPIVHYIKDPTQRTSKKHNPIHTVVDDPIDLSYMGEKEALSYFRDIMATWYYIMAEKYGRSKREEIMHGKHNFVDAFEVETDYLMKTVDRYDSSIERAAHYQPKEYVKPETVFESIANIGNPTRFNVLDKEYAANLVQEREREDFQSRY